jgi:hypothetical protein
LDSREQPRESDLEYVASLSCEDVQAIDAAVFQQLATTWMEARDLVAKAHFALLSKYPTVPDVFVSYRLRKLVDAGDIEAAGAVDRQLNYWVRAKDLISAA